MRRKGEGVIQNAVHNFLLNNIWVAVDQVEASPCSCKLQGPSPAPRPPPTEPAPPDFASKGPRDRERATDRMLFPSTLQRGIFIMTHQRSYCPVDFDFRNRSGV